MAVRGKARFAAGALIAVLPFLCVFVALFMGRYEITPGDVALSLAMWIHEGLRQAVLRVAGLVGAQGADVGALDLGVSAQAYNIVVEVRLPRALAAAAVGGALAASGAAYQGVFRNPLVNPGLLGVSNGAGFGAACAIVVAGGGALIYPSAFAFGILAVALSYWIARVYRQTPTIMLILGGTIVSSVFASLVSLMKYVADPENQLPAIVYWLMGSLASVSWQQFWAVVPIALGSCVLIALSWRIDVLSMGDKEARSLGVDVTRNKAAVVSGATLATAGAVCLSGVVGWVGLVVPHIGRMIVGSSNSQLIPASFAVGASFLVVVDTVARCLWSSEVPLGILTALIGAPFFVYLLKRTKGGVWK